MFAIVETGGKQYKVAPGSALTDTGVPRPCGSTHPSGVPTARRGPVEVWNVVTRTDAAA